MPSEKDLLSMIAAYVASKGGVNVTMWNTQYADFSFDSAEDFREALLKLQSRKLLDFVTQKHKGEIDTYAGVSVL